MGDAKIVSIHFLIGGVYSKRRRASNWCKIVWSGRSPHTDHVLEFDGVKMINTTLFNWHLVGHHCKVWSMMSCSTEWAISVSTGS